MNGFNQESDPKRTKFESLLSYLQDVQRNVSGSKIIQAALVTFAGYATYKYLSDIIRRRVKGYPNGPFCFPFIGSGLKVYTEKFLVNSCGLYGAITLYKIWGKRILLINNSQVAKHLILNKKEFMDHYQFGVSKTKDEYVLLGVNPQGTRPSDTTFLAANGKQWKTRRQYAMVALVRYCDSKLMAKIIHDVMKNVGFKTLDQLCDQSDNNNNIWHPEELCYYFAFNTVYHANFGHSLDINDKKLLKLRKIIETNSTCFKQLRITIMSNLIYYLYKYILKPDLVKTFENNAKESQKLYLEMIKERRAYFESHPDLLNNIINNENNKYQLCYIDYLVYLLYFADNNNNSNNNNNGKENEKNNHKNSSKKRDRWNKNERVKLNEIKVMNDLSIMFFAGTDTTASTLQYGVFLLAKSPEIQEKLHNLLKERIVNEEVLQVKELMDCDEYRAFVYEVLRISAAVPFSLTHYLEKDYKIKISDDEEYILPGDSLINLNIEYIQRGNSPNEHWKNKECKLGMEDICLENWLVEDKTSNNDHDGKVQYKFKMNDSFISFGYGIRDCVGQQLAIKEVHLIFGYLILNYQIKAVNGDPSFKINRQFGIVTNCHNPEGVVICKR